jgi:glycosyltransferase involved in cell wall biosynthesis
MPVVEAMSRGAAVVCSNTTSLPEVAGDAALYCDPHDPESIAAVIARLEGDEGLRSRLRALAEGRSESFHWPTSAGVVLKVYHQVLQLPPLRNT